MIFVIQLKIPLSPKHLPAMLRDLQLTISPIATVRRRREEGRRERRRGGTAVREVERLIVLASDADSIVEAELGARTVPPKEALSRERERIRLVEWMRGVKRCNED